MTMARILKTSRRDFPKLGPPKGSSDIASQVYPIVEDPKDGDPNRTSRFSQETLGQTKQDPLLECRHMSCESV